MMVVLGGLPHGRKLCFVVVMMVVLGPVGYVGPVGYGFISFIMSNLTRYCIGVQIMVGYFLSTSEIAIFTLALD